MRTATLFNRDDQLTFALLHAMLQTPNLTIPRTALADDYGLTTYRINKYFDAINTDLQAISVDKPVYLDETQQGFWHANNLTTYSLQRLSLLYLQRSSAFLVFEYQFLYSQLLSKRDYIAKQAISTPVFYSVSTSLDKILQSEGFFTANGGYDDPEYVLRLHLFELYYTAYTGVATPFASMKPIVDGLLKRCNALIGAPLRPSQVTRLSLFLKLWLLRIRNGGQITSDLLPPGLPGAKAQAFMADIQHYLQRLQPIDQREASYLYTYLVVQGFVPVASRAQLTLAFPQAAQLTQQFIQALAAQDKLIDRSRLDTTKLQTSLDAIHVQFTTFFVEPTTFIDQTRTTFFQDLYPGFDLVITAFIDSLKRTSHISNNTASNLYFSYMFALISAVPARALNDLVYICVDFSQGTLYSDYVIQTLAAFNHAHIVIEANVSPTTDIYISDFHSDLVAHPQVVWQNPPTPNDWSTLADMILEIKQAKTNTLMH